MLFGPMVQAQIVHETPSRVKAANRRALRDAQRTDSPYKDSHLGVTPARLKRGQSTQPQAQPVRRAEVDYKTAPAPEPKPGSFLSQRRKKKV